MEHILQRLIKPACQFAKSRLKHARLALASVLGKENNVAWCILDMEMSVSLPRSRNCRGIESINKYGGIVRDHVWSPACYVLYPF